MSEIPIDPNSVKIITPPMLYIDGKGLSRLFVGAEFEVGPKKIKFGFYVSTGTSTPGTSNMKNKWAPCWGINESNGVIMKIVGDNSKYGREKGVLFRVCRQIDKLIPPDKQEKIITQKKASVEFWHFGIPTPRAKERMISTINARFKREGIFKTPFYYEKEFKKINDKILDPIKEKEKELGRKLSGPEHDALLRSILSPGEFEHYHASIDDNDDDYWVTIDGTPTNEGRIKLSEAALRRLIWKLVWR